MRFISRLILLFICLSSFTAFAQDEDDDLEGEFNRKGKKDAESKESFFSKLKYGGQFWLSFGNPTYIEISPMAFYPVNEKLMTGLGFTYMYQSVTQGANRFEFNVFGPRALGQYYFTQNLFAHTEIEALNLPFYDPWTNQEVRDWVVSPLVGAGYIQRFGNGVGGIYFSFLYNLTHNPDRSPYGSPLVLRMGMIF